MGVLSCMKKYMVIILHLASTNYLLDVRKCSESIIFFSASGVPSSETPSPAGGGRLHCCYSVCLVLPTVGSLRSHSYITDICDMPVLSFAFANRCLNIVLNTRCKALDNELLQYNLRGGGLSRITVSNYDQHGPFLTVFLA